MASLSPNDVLKLIGVGLAAALAADIVTGASTRREMQYQMTLMRLRAENEALKAVRNGRN